MQIDSLPHGATLDGGKFIVEHPIGHGGFGITYIAEDVSLDRTVVIKECFADGYCARDGNQVIVKSEGFGSSFAQIVRMFVREAQSIALLQHPNIVDVHQIFEENGTAYMVLDLIEGRDLAEVIELDDSPMEPDQIHALLVKLLDAVNLVHFNKLLHRDISPDNILLDKWGSPILIDFGAVRDVSPAEGGGSASMLVVKDGYSPPEFYQSGAVQSECSDVYALGATIYHLISGQIPPSGQERFEAVSGGHPDPCTPLSGRFDAFDDVILETVDAAMRVDPADRLQSAKHWAERIEDEQEKARVLKLTPRVGLEALTAMIEDVNRDLDDTSAAQNADKRGARVKSVILDAAHYRPERPEWAVEFNLETAHVASRKPGHAHIAKRANRYARYAQRENEARAALAALDQNTKPTAAQVSLLQRIFQPSQWFAVGRVG